MTTYGELVEQVRSLLRSYTGLHEQMTWLTVACGTGELTLAVNDASAVSVGISELEEELVYVASSDVDTATITLAPFGRGYDGTTAASHAINSRVTFNPAFPTANIKRAINQVLAGTYPLLYQIKTTTFTFSGSVATYELPADVDGIVKVQYEMTGPSNHWPMLSTWEFEPNAAETSGKAITLHEAPEQGATVRVTYRANFDTLVNSSDTLTSVGFPESAVDVLLYGSVAQLVRFLDVSRLQTGSAENASRSQLVGSGDPSRIANQMYGMYQQRLQEERKKLLELHPPQIHFTR